MSQATHRPSKSLPFILTEKSKNSFTTSKLLKTSLVHKLPSSEPMRKFLKTSRKLKNESIEHYTGQVGVSAKIDFYDSFKKLPAITERNKYMHIEESPNIAYLEEIQRSRIKPQPFGVVRTKGSESCIDLNGFSMGDNYAGALSRSLKYFTQIEYLNLKDNRLTEIGATNLLSNLVTKRLKVLDLTDNKLGGKSLEQIAKLLENPDGILVELHLEHTRARENSMIGVIQALMNNNTLTMLNLSKNSLTNLTARALKEVLLVNNTVIKIDLHWNKITGAGGLMVFEGLESNNSIQELDFSWNSIGNSLEVSEKIAKILSKQQSLLHLDFSFNYFTIEESKFIAEGLQQNHYLLGLHMEGNNCSVDSNGFIICEPNSSLLTTGLPIKRIFKSQKPNSKCWVCEKWVESTLEISTHFSSPIFIHIDIDNFSPYLLQEKGNSFAISRALPQKEVNFFFSTHSGTFLSQLYQTCEVSPVYRFSDSSPGISLMNVYIPNGCILDIQNPFGIKPRLKNYFKTGYYEERIIWTIENSLFKDYIFDSQKLMNDCFQFDWRMTRVKGIIKNAKDRKKAKRYLRSIYEYIRLCYKSMSCLSGSEMFSIGSNIMTDFLYECKLIDNLYAINDFGVNWNSANVPQVKNQLFNPGNALVRYEFMELLIRIAYDRFFRNKLTREISSAVEKLFEEHIIPSISMHKLNDISSYNSNAWRNDIYICEDVDLVLKVFKPILDFAFSKYSGKKTLPGCKKFMSTDEFFELCKDCNFANETISSREICFCYVQAMITQVDEYFKKRHFEMSFVEFLEAITRVIDLRERENPSALSVKLEISLRNLIQLCPRYIVESFIIPDDQTFHKMKYKVISEDIITS